MSCEVVKNFCSVKGIVLVNFIDVFCCIKDVYYDLIFFFVALSVLWSFVHFITIFPCACYCLCMFYSFAFDFFLCFIFWFY